MPVWEYAKLQKDSATAVNSDWLHLGDMATYGVSHAHEQITLKQGHTGCSKTARFKFILETNGADDGFMIYRHYKKIGWRFLFRHAVDKTVNVHLGPSARSMFAEMQTDVADSDQIYVEVEKCGLPKETLFALYAPVTWTFAALVRKIKEILQNAKYITAQSKFVVDNYRRVSCNVRLRTLLKQSRSLQVTNKKRPIEHVQSDSD